jgi:hypothetical protein
MLIGLLPAEGDSPFWKSFKNAKNSSRKISVSINESNILSWDSTHLLWNAPNRKKTAFLLGINHANNQQYGVEIVPWKLDSTFKVSKIWIGSPESSNKESGLVPCYLTFADSTGTQLPIVIYINRPEASTYHPLQNVANSVAPVKFSPTKVIPVYNRQPDNLSMTPNLPHSEMAGTIENPDLQDIMMPEPGIYEPSYIPEYPVPENIPAYPYSYPSEPNYDNNASGNPLSINSYGDNPEIATPPLLYEPIVPEDDQ